MARVYNFSAGPSMLPEKVLKQAQAELLEYGGSGQSVMEMSHRSKWFDAIITDTEATLRRVMNIPDHYKVGFFQGGATQQFAMVPLNFMTTARPTTSSPETSPIWPQRKPQSSARPGSSRPARIRTSPTSRT